MEIKKILTAQVIENIRKDISESSQQEIFLIGLINPETGLVSDYNLLARGNLSMVPAIIKDLKPGMLIIHNHPSGDLSPSAADIRVASRAGNMGAGFAIINNSVDEIYVVVEPHIPSEERAIAAEEVLALFAEEGGLSQHLNDYEYRKQQIEVVQEIVASFNQHNFNFIEAGTGTGKSLAYLIPALYWSKENQVPVVISTNTINLQEQLINKDLVLLKRILPFSFKAVLVKGRNNYVCKRKVKNLRQRLPEDQQKAEEFMKILNWLEETASGSRSEPDFSIAAELWEEIASESELCLKTRCPYFNSCYFMKARKEIYSADLLIINHHLLIADAVLKQEALDSEMGILPKYRNLIIDEAHNFIDVATNQLGKTFNNQILNKYLEQLWHNNLALFPRLREKLSTLSSSEKEAFYKQIDTQIIPQVQRLKDFSSSYFHILEELISEEAEMVVRLTPEILSKPIWSQIKETGEKLAAYLNHLLIFLQGLAEKLFKHIDEDDSLDELLLELEAAIIKGNALLNNLEINLALNDNNYVFWLEKKGTTVSQKNAPLVIADILNNLLWCHLDNLILTSATLTVGDSFQFFQEELGLSKSKTLQIPSPFDYQKQARLIIPEDIPPANSPLFLDKIMTHLKEILINFSGRTMVLFTSYSMLNHCLSYLRNDLEEAGLKLLAQGDYSRRYIVETFRKSEGQIIFGTVSFWEGIDIKGDKLQYLIIMKLPFPVPSEPIAAARMDKLAQEGKNPFFNYSLPRAVIRFKQGFGRLIRSQKDRGLVISLDNRLITKSYGSIFLKSLPSACPVEFKSIAELKTLSID